MPSAHSTISAGQWDFCAQFHSRQLHNRKLVKTKGLGRLSFPSTFHQAMTTQRSGYSKMLS
ncbi:MAG: hypothetical protein QOG14_2360 [Mycobacterium sp.]|jgi:hypothetical protein|nr:hypothetical protein [Mycobacterium sp.]